MIINLMKAVVPGYYLVCYNNTADSASSLSAVVPGYYLVCYNWGIGEMDLNTAVVPGYYLVCYNFWHYTKNAIKL